MPVKILLADKSITIQKVVEMLFSGKEYEVTCVSDGETALGETTRIVPGVVLADVDLPRIDGYSFAARLKGTPSLAHIPVILMLSRDDQFDAGRGRQSGIVDTIAKPFESQELIGKVKKAIAAAPVAAPAAPAARPAPQPKPVEAPAPRPGTGVPSDIFGIIEEAPSRTEPAKPAPPPSKPLVPAPAPAEEAEFEVEPEYEVEPEIEGAGTTVPPAGGRIEEEIEAEVLPETPDMVADAFEAEQLFGKPPEHGTGPAIGLEAEIGHAPPTPKTFDFSEPLPSDAEAVLPIGARAMEEMREGLGLGEPAAEEAGIAPGGHPDFVSFESLDMASRVSHEEYAPPVPEKAPAAYAPAPAPEPSPGQPSPPPVVTDAMLQAVCQEAVEKFAKQVLERVAWEVIPDLAERLIREEIERLKGGS
jgi:CheY-like chemotaxis protein